MRIQSKYLEEKLTAADPTSKWISDFVHSDNPKFAGKSKKERIRMALGASYAAKGKGTQNEALTGSSLNTLTKGRIKMPSDAGEPSYVARKKATQAQQAIVDKNYIKKVTTAAKRGSSTNTGLTAEENTPPPFTPDNNKAPIAKPGKAGYGPSAAKHLAKMAMKKQKNEEVEQIDELEASTLNSYITGRQGNTAKRISAAMDKIEGKPSKHGVYDTGLKRAQQKIDDKRKKETGMNPQKPRPAQPPAYPLGGRDPASGRSYSESTEIDEGIGGAIAGGIGQFIGNKIDPLHGEILRTHGEMAGRKAEYTIRKHLNKLHKALKSYLSSGNATNEEVEPIDELDKRTLMSYVSNAAYDGVKQGQNTMSKDHETSNKALDKAMKRLGGIRAAVRKIGSKKNEEVEQVDELSKSTLASYAKQASHDARIKMAIGKDFERISKTSKKPAYKDSAKEWEEKYKTDARRREAGVNKAIDRLAKEEVEQVDELKKSTLASYIKNSQTDKSFYAADMGRMSSAGDTVSPSYANIRRKHKNRGAGINRAVDRLTKEEVEQVDEISQNTALNAYAQRAVRAATTKDPKDQDKADKSITRIGKRWTADAQRRAWNRADKLIYKEETELDEGKKKGLWDNIHAKRKRGERPARPGEKGYPKTLNIEGTELDEAGRMQGGGKDPCWKGYKMIGTKNKAGREVPNCVPVKEEKTFKSLREELNGNDQSN